MGRNFSGSNQWLYQTTGVPTTYPLTLAAFVNPTALPTTGAGAGVIDIGGTTTTYGMTLSLDQGGTISATSAGTSSATTTFTVTLGTWYHVAAVFASATSRAVYVNGANKVTDATNAAFSTPVNRINIGACTYGATAGTFTSINGLIAFPAIWKATLVDADILALSKGIGPKRYHSNNLISYLWDSEGDSPVPDLVLPNRWTLNGASTVSANPAIYGP